MTLYFCMKMKVTVLFWLKDKSPYDVASNLLAAAKQPIGDLSNTPYKQLTHVCPGHIPPLFVQTSLNQIPRVRSRLPTNRPTNDRPRWIGLNFRFRRPSCVAHPRCGAGASPLACANRRYSTWPFPRQAHHRIHHSSPSGKWYGLITPKTLQWHRRRVVNIL